MRPYTPTNCLYLTIPNPTPPYTTIRLFNSYGPNQTKDYFIPAKIYEALGTGRIHLAGRFTKNDFVFISDVVDAYIKLLESDFVGEINIGSGVSTTLESIAKLISETIGVPLTFAPEEAFTFMQCDTSRAKRVLGWEARVPLEAGLRRTIESYKEVWATAH